MGAWWHRYPGVLEREKAALDALGYQWEIDEAAQRAGRLVIHVEASANGEPLRLTAEYPAAFPYFLPQVTLEDKTFVRHQHPFGKNLCLLARDGEDWQPGVDTLATLLSEQLPQVLQVNTEGIGPDVIAAVEDHVGEPLSSFLPYLPESAILVPDDTPPAGQQAGRLVLATRPLPAAAGFPPIVGVLKTVSDIKRNVLVDFPLRLQGLSAEVPGFWLRLSERPAFDGALRPEDAMIKAMAAKVPEFDKTVRAAAQGQVIVAGFVYQDERSWRESADDWVFVAIRIRRKEKGARPAQIQSTFIRADWAGERAWMQRAPALRPLRDKSALVVGLGSLGSPLVMNLARAGIGRLNLVDSDHLQAGNTVRWALGWQFAGAAKARALTMELANQYPYTKVHACNARIGDLTPPAEREAKSDYDLIRSYASEADLIVDAAASYRVSHLLSDLAKEMGKPYLWLTTTHGAAGGVVGRVVPNKTGGCWHCFLRHLTDGSIARPADSGGGEIQPGGCSQPTFIGAGLDSDEIALLASRLAVATLCDGSQDGYPNFAWDVGVADLYANGNPIAATWKTYNLLAHQECPACRPK
jgi:molybdopterin/thiamine biosynthesis adenylyltransferase